MPGLPWFDEVAERLIARHLPPGYVQRFVRELADHFEDLKEETMGLEAEALTRLGEPRHVAAAAIKAYGRRNLLARHSALKFLVFAVSPILSLIVLAIAGLFVLLALARGLGYVDSSGTHVGDVVKALLPYILTAMTIVIPAAVLTGLYFSLARRLGIGRRWMLASCLVLSVLAGLAMCDVTLSELPGQSRLTYGLGIGFGTADLLRMGKALAPLGLGLWLLRRSRPQELGVITGGTPVPT
jgi:hypothetical protein